MFLLFVYSKLNVIIIIIIIVDHSFCGLWMDIETT